MKNRKQNRVWKKYFNLDYLKKLVYDANYITPACILLMILEVLLNIFIIETVKYTEIDWIAYMQEVEGFLNGTFDYKDLRGDTGPLVYPAGFVYIYSIFYYITSYGKNIYLTQYIFLGIFLIQTYLVHRIYRITAIVPPYALVLATLTSYRIHSIYVLRLFNDPIAVLLFYISLNLFISNKWYLGSIFYSLAVSVKMNILLYAPCLLLAYIKILNIKKTVIHLFLCGVIQLILALPFLIVNPFSYLKGSFDLGRVFEHQWTVNYRFLPKNVFENRYFHLSLLVLHIALLYIFWPLANRCLKQYNILKRAEDSMYMAQKFLQENDVKSAKDKDDLKFKTQMAKKARLLVLPFFVANLIGVACARSLHYQFYSWYFHSLLYLVFCTEYTKPFTFLLLAMIEYCWNVYPSTIFSSCLLHVCHIVLLSGLYWKMRK